MWTYTYDVSKALTAVRDGEIDTTKSKIEIYRQAQQFWSLMGFLAPGLSTLKVSVPLTVTTAVTNPILDGSFHPKFVFHDVDRGLLRCLWGSEEEEWIELPGPADIWPNDPRWYAFNGFEPRPDQAFNYKKALDCLKDEYAKPQWANYLLHDHAPFDLVWNKYFGLG